MKNPIKNNRIVNDITFAIRLRHFLRDVQPYDASSEEEIDYFSWVAQDLIDYQVKTATNPNEIDYLKRLNLL